MSLVEPIVVGVEDEAAAGPAPAATAARAPLTSPLTLDFLTWLAGGPRLYAEAMEAWRSSCPRFTIWEDAISDGLIECEGGAGITLSAMKVTLTAKGRAVLAGE